LNVSVMSLRKLTIRLSASMPRSWSPASCARANGRYWLENEELACGRSVELLYSDDRGVDDTAYWHAGRIDHNGIKYYFTGNRNLELEGMTARIKQHL